MAYENRKYSNDAFIIKEEFTSFIDGKISSENKEVLLVLSDVGDIGISDIDIINFIGKEHISDLSYSFHVSHHYFYTLYRWASGQGGAIGIMDLKTGDWVFQESGDEYISDGVVYLPEWNRHLSFVDLQTYGWGLQCLSLIEDHSSEMLDYTLYSWEADHSTMTKKVKTSHDPISNKQYGKGTTGWIPLAMLDEEARFSFNTEKRIFCYDNKVYSLPDFQAPN